MSQALFVRRLALAVFLVSTLAGSGDCGGGDDPSNYIGSVWSYDFELTEAPSPGAGEIFKRNFEVTRTRMQGRFRVTDGEIDDHNDDLDEYRIELLPGTVSFDVHVAPFHFTHPANSDIYEECDGFSGSFQHTLKAEHPDVSMRFYNNGDTYHAEHSMFPSAGDTTGIFNLDWDTEGPSTEFHIPCRTGNSRFGQVYPSDLTEYASPTMPWGYLPVAEGHFLATMIGGSFDDIAYGASLRLRCVSGCEPVRETVLDPAPEPTSKACDLESLRQECRAFRYSIVGYCRTLDNWMVVYTDTSSVEPEYACATSDCSSAIADHAASDPWTGITKTLDLACGGENAGQEVCHVECYGWNPQ